MHSDEIDIDAGLVGRLVAAQFPQWEGARLTRVGAHGTDHAIFRLGDRLAVRLPRHPGAAGQVEKEQAWLPRLAPHLPTPIPAPVAAGVPTDSFPWPWSICVWLEGEPATEAPLQHDAGVGRALGAFVKSMGAIPADGAPAPGPHNAWRGVDLKARDKVTRRAIEALGDQIDGDAARSVWDRALEARRWEGPPIWLHGDLMPGNLLLQGERLAGVLDFGCMGAGDPACDLIPAWNLLAGQGREAFHAAADLDAASLARGRGWALSVALVQLPYYQETNQVIAANARRTIGQALAG